MKGLATEQERFTQAEMIDPPGVCAAERPLEVARVAARDDSKHRAKGRVDRIGKCGQLGHVPGVGCHSAAAGQIGTDAFEHDVRAAKRLTHDILEVAGHDAFTEVSELDHEHDPVHPLRSLCRGRKLADDVQLGVEAHVGVRDNPVLPACPSAPRLPSSSTTARWSGP